MRMAFSTALAIVLSPAAAASAADPITIPISTNAELPLIEPAEFDWNRFYAGVHGGSSFGTDTQQAVLGVHAGVNAQFDYYLLGAEIAVSGLPGADLGPETMQGEILGRAGLVLADDAVVYAAGGYGIDLLSPQDQDVLVGGGFEFGVTDTLSVRAQYLHGMPVTAGAAESQVTFGTSIHF